MPALPPPEPVAPSPLAALVLAGRGGPRRRARLFWIAGVLLLLGLLFVLPLLKRARESEAPAFATTPLARGDIALTITATGKLEPTNEVTIGSELSGTILTVLVDLNDRVTRGQLLAELDTTRLRQQIAGGRAGLQSAQASVAQAEATARETAANLRRLEDLRRASDGRLPSRTDYDTALAAADRAAAALLVARAGEAQAEADLRISENDLAKARITSPIDGIVLRRSVEPGQTVAASFAAPELFVIAEKLEHMKLTVSVAEADIGRLAAGQAASFAVDAWPDRTYRATVRRVAFGSAVTNNVVTYATELEVANADLSLRPGMTATAEIRVAERKNVFLVPAAALRFDPEKGAAPGAAAPPRSFVQSLAPLPPRQPSGRAAAGEDTTPPPLDAEGRHRVWILRDGAPEPLPVRLGLSDGRRVEILAEGLSEGLPIITRALPVPAR